jgi:hypothetical protein
MGWIRSTCERSEKFEIRFSLKSSKEDLCVDAKIILKWIIKKYSGNVWAGLKWLRIETSGELL